MFPHPGPPEALRPKAFLGDATQPATLAALSAAPATMQVDGTGQAFVVGIFCWEENVYGLRKPRQKGELCVGDLTVFESLRGFCFFF